MTWKSFPLPLGPNASMGNICLSMETHSTVIITFEHFGERSEQSKKSRDFLHQSQKKHVFSKITATKGDRKSIFVQVCNDTTMLGQFTECLKRFSLKK